MIGVNFNTFASAVVVLNKASQMAVDAKIQNKETQMATVEIDVNLGAVSRMAMPAWTAFAIEMGLKTLLVKTTTEHKPHGHSLLSLFKKLPEASRVRIENDVFDHHKYLDGEDFFIILEREAKAFESWRYFHELESSSSNIQFLLALMIAISQESVRIQTIK